MRNEMQVAVQNRTELNVIDEFTGGGLSWPITCSLFARHYTEASDFAGLDVRELALFLSLFGPHGDERIGRSKDYRHLYGLGVELAMAATMFKYDIVIPLIEHVRSSAVSQRTTPPVYLNESIAQLLHCCPEYGPAGAIYVAAFSAAYRVLIGTTNNNRKDVNVWNQQQVFDVPNEEVPALSPAPFKDLHRQLAKQILQYVTESKDYAKYFQTRVFIPIIVEHIKQSLELHPKGVAMLEKSTTQLTPQDTITSTWVKQTIPGVIAYLQYPGTFNNMYKGLYLFDKTKSSICVERAPSINSEVVVTDIIKGTHQKYAIVARLSNVDIPLVHGSIMWDNSNKKAPPQGYGMLLPMEVAMYMKAFE